MRVKRKYKHELVEACRRLESEGYECTHPITLVTKFSGNRNHTYYQAELERVEENG